ncbi:MAG: hypothetical protein FWG94_04410 [Oscillospiraceae bacterium]|nr:hypothetical protein [Oscillospiraceae bacterium]
MTTTTIVRNNTKSKSALFLLELVIAIAFLALSSVICIRFFVAAHTISRQASDLNMAVIQTQSVAEVFKASGGDRAKIEDTLNPSIGECGAYQVFFDADWQPLPSGDHSVYSVNFTVESEGSIDTAEISAWNNTPGADGNGREIYSLTAKIYSGQVVLR